MCLSYFVNHCLLFCMTASGDRLRPLLSLHTDVKKTMLMNVKNDSFGAKEWNLELKYWELFKQGLSYKKTCLMSDSWNQNVNYIGTRCEISKHSKLTSQRVVIPWLSIFSYKSRWEADLTVSVVFFVESSIL